MYISCNKIHLIDRVKMRSITATANVHVAYDVFI